MVQSCTYIGDLMELIFEESCTYTAQDRYTMINQFLKTAKVAVVTFKKKDGQVRVMPCTTDTSLMPADESSKFHQTRTVNWNNMPVWALDKNAWRQFNTMNVISVEVKND